MVTKTFIDLGSAEAGFPTWQKANKAWQVRAAKGPGVSGGPKRTRTAYFYGSGFFQRPPRARPVRPDQDLRARPAVADDLLLARPVLALSVDRAHARARAWVRPATASRRRSPDRRAVPQRLTIVAPSPPSPRSPARKLFTRGCEEVWARTASRSAPVPSPWMIRTCSRPASDASSR